MSRLVLRIALAAALFTSVAGCAEPEEPSRTERDEWTLTRDGAGVGRMTLECAYYTQIALCTQVVDIGEPGAPLEQMQRTIVLSRQHPRTRYVQFVQHELGLAGSFDREKKRHHPERAVLEIHALTRIAQSGRVWAALPVVHPRTGDEVSMRCLAAPAADATRLWCTGQSGSLLAEVAMGGQVDWMRNASGVEALRAGAETPCDADCREAFEALRAGGPTRQALAVEPNAWRAGVRIAGPISEGASLDVLGRQRAWIAPDRSYALVHVMAEPQHAAGETCLTPALIDTVRHRVRAIPPARNPSVTAGRSADCTEDAKLAVSVLRDAGCDARAVVGYARGGDLDGWHAWVEVQEHDAVRTLDPRSGRAPVPAGWVRTGLLERQDTVAADADVMNLRFVFLEPAAVLAQIDAAGSDVSVDSDGP